MVFEAYVEFDIGHMHFHIDADSPIIAMRKLCNYLEEEERQVGYLELVGGGFRPPMHCDTDYLVKL